MWINRGLLGILWGIFLFVETAGADSFQTDIVVDRTLYFSSSETSEVIVEPGTYFLEKVVGPWLQLKTETQEGVFLRGMATTHDENLDTAVALAVAVSENEYHLVLLLPDGQGLEVVGSPSGITSRGGFPPFARKSLSAAIKAAKQRPGALVAPPPPSPSGAPPATASSATTGNVEVRDHRKSANPPPTDFELAYYHAPIHYQDTNSSNYLADYVTRFDYDGDWIATNNWENMTRFPLTAHVSYSVVESCSHWYINYAFFHPRDWTNDFVSPLANEHENDMEGFMSIVRKDGSRFGRLEGMVTSSHWDFYSYTPAGSPLTNGKETIDGRVTMQVHDGSTRPLTSQEDKGHGVKALPFSFERNLTVEDFIIYYPSRTQAQVPQSGNDRQVNYTLIDLFASGGLWELQLEQAQASVGISPTIRDHRDIPQPISLPLNPFYTWATFKGDKGGGCGAGKIGQCSTNSPQPPWGWDDRNDGPVYAGHMALDPAYLVDRYFDGLGSFSTKYLRNRYITDLQNRGFRSGRVPVGWPTLLLPDVPPVERINLDQLFTKMTNTCP